MQNVFFKYFPLLGFGLIWILVISLHQLYLYNLHPVSAGTYQVLIFGILSIILGYYILAIFDNKTNAKPAKSNYLTVDTALLSKLVIVLTVICGFGAFLTIYIVGSNLGGMDIYITRPLMVRQFFVAVQRGDEIVSPLYRVGSYLSNVGFLSMVLGGILFANKGKIRLIGLLPFSALLVSQLAVMGRYKFVSGLFFFLVSFILFSYYLQPQIRKIRLLEIFTYSFLSVTIILTLSYFILKFRSPLADDIISILKETGYLYFSGGITALDKFFSTDFIYSYGEQSFSSVFDWLAKFGIWPEDELAAKYGEFVRVSPSYRINTYTFIQTLYHDFGIYGVLIVSFIWGAVSKIMVFRVFKKFTITNVVLACIFVFSLIMSFFSFYFQGLSTIMFWVIVAFVLQYFFGDKLFIRNEGLQKESFS